jgi:hypothetical protein
MNKPGWNCLHRTENPRVGGSIPPLATMYFLNFLSLAIGVRREGSVALAGSTVQFWRPRDPEMTKPVVRDFIYRRRRFDAEIIELCVRWYMPTGCVIAAVPKDLKPPIEAHRHRAGPSDSQEAILARTGSISEFRVAKAALGPSTRIISPGRSRFDSRFAPFLILKCTAIAANA